LPIEVEPNSPNSTTIAVRLQDGSKVERRFSILAKIQDIMDFIDTKIEQDVENVQLMSNFPTRCFTDMNETIQDAKLYPQALLFLQQKEHQQ